jgi:hypothetical protein
MAISATAAHQINMPGPQISAVIQTSVGARLISTALPINLARRNTSRPQIALLRIRRRSAGLKRIAATLGTLRPNIAPLQRKTETMPKIAMARKTTIKPRTTITVQCSRIAASIMDSKGM